MNVLIVVGTAFLYLASGGSGGQSTAAIAMEDGAVENGPANTRSVQDEDRTNPGKYIEPVLTPVSVVKRYSPATKSDKGERYLEFGNKAKDETFSLHGGKFILRHYEYDSNAKIPPKIHLVDSSVSNGETWKITSACWDDSAGKLVIKAKHEEIHSKPGSSFRPGDPGKKDPPIGGTLTVILDPIDDMHPAPIQIPTSYVMN